ncbi:MAG: TetR/AcrR family transcriptional regulator [Promethearchaeota archaeon]|nr:MAG: TetR/AcrR family transcriptional regulator [Candidatus Lokiarchaeota archaeon]
MKRHGARELILQVSKKLVDKNGYGNTNIIDIAKQADVSVGTLYYHFPRGKIDILMALTKEIIQYFKEEAERMGFKAGMEFLTVREALNYYLALIIKLHKKYRLTLAGWESEILSNLDYYIKLRDEVEIRKEFPDELNLFIREMKELIKKFPDENLSIEGKEKQLYIITQAIIHKYTYDNYGFNSDEELINLLSKIILTILKDRE